MVVFKNTIVDAAAVFTFLANHYDQSINNEFPAFRSLITTNLSQYVMFGDLKLKASGGVMYSDTHVYSDFSPGVGLLDLKIGGEAGYTFFGKLEPYIAAYSIYDALAPRSVDPDGIEALAGVNYSPIDALKLAFAANPKEARRLMRRSLSAGLTKAVLIGPEMEAALTDDSDGSLARFSATLLRIGLVRRP